MSWHPGDVRYARTPGGAHIAYQAFGDGVPLLFCSGGFIPVDFMDDEPGLADGMRRLASFCRVVRFDRRGVGGSDPVTPAEPPTLEQWVEDAVAVLDAAGCADAAVVGDSDGGLIALALAAIHPQRVRSLVLINAFARVIAAPDHPWGLTPDYLETARRASLDPIAPEGDFDILTAIAPSVADDPDFRRWWDRVGRRGASPATAIAFRRVVEESDVRSLLPSVRAPALILHRGGVFSPFGQGRYLHRMLPASQLVELPGVDELWWLGDQSRLLREIEAFLTGQVAFATNPRPFLTVLFTDIVDSTRCAAGLGDEKWGELLKRYEGLARREVAAGGGHYVKSTGDGCLAWFDGPVRALRAGLALRRAAAELGLEVRTAVHVGEVDLHGADLIGLNVHVASRVLGFAGSGEVLVTQPIVDLAAGAGFGFAPREARCLKGVPGEWPLYSVHNGTP